MPLPFQEYWDWITREYSLQQIPCRQILQVLPCTTARMNSLSIMRALLCAICCWQMRSTVLLLKHSLLFRRVTVDGVTRPLPTPFICIATQNPLGTTGTQALPSSQLDRFMVRLSIGYPSAEDQIKILKARRYSNPLEEIQVAAQAENILEIQNYLSALKISDDILYYLIRLCEATREHPLVELGISPRGVWALTKMAKAWAILKDRSYVIPEDVQEVFTDVCAHRLILKPQARLEGISEKEILQDILKETKPLKDPKRWNA